MGKKGKSSDNSSGPSSQVSQGSRSDQRLSDQMENLHFRQRSEERGRGGDAQTGETRGRGRGRGRGRSDGGAQRAFRRDQSNRPGPPRGPRNDESDIVRDRSRSQYPEERLQQTKQTQEAPISSPATFWKKPAEQSYQGPPPGMRVPTLASASASASASPAPAPAPVWGIKKQQQQQQLPPRGFKKSTPSSSTATLCTDLNPGSSSRSNTSSSSSGGGGGGGGGGCQSQQQELTVTSIDVKKMPEREKNRLIDLIPVRKNLLTAGTAGKKIKVKTNMMEITFDKNFKISATHYDIKFDPDKPKMLKRLAFNEIRLIKFPNNWPAFDGRANVYSAGDLPFGNSITCDVQVTVDNESQEKKIIKVTLTKANVIDIEWFKNIKPGIKEYEKNLTSMQVLDVVLRCASYDKAIMVGRSFFQRPKNPINLSGGMELWTGLFQSAVLGWKPYFNVDIAHKSFPISQSVINAIKELCTTFRKPCNNVTPDVINDNYDKINSYLKMLKVTYQLPNKPSTKRTVGINGIDKPPGKATFVMSNGETTTVLAYFSGSKQYKIQYPELPCLWVGSRQKNPHILVPMELCTIAPGNITNRKLDEQQTTNMIKESATKPLIRQNKIMDAFNNMNFHNNNTMKEFGINVSGKFTEVDARVLQAPLLCDKNNIRVNKGVWNATKFYTTQDIPDKSWTILNLSRINENYIYEFVCELKKNSNGMNIGEPDKPFKSMQLRSNDIRQLIDYLNLKKNQGLKLIVVIIPGRGTDIYPIVKQVAELKVGILTQCVKDNTVERKMNKMTAGNILLKLNSKLNGINHIISPQDKPNCLKVPCMFIGADVTHPSPDSIDIPSIAAVAASFEQTAFKYNVTIKLQPPRQEIISDLTEIIYNQLNYFIEINKKKPEKIIYYRDGVSEGQFPQIMHYELSAIRNACIKIGGPNNKYQPKITFLVVQKRHHIRLFPSDPKNSDDRAGNVQAGTIVDTEITHPSHVDFYLVSHASIQGTAKPTKYRCLWDDNDMTEDEIEKLTYYLCHMFSRCTRSVSYPAPTYYAHLAAFRARALTHNVRIKLNNLPFEQRDKLTLCPDFHSKNPMFFV